jgi:fructokinase
MKKYSVITLGESLIDFIPLTDLVSGKYKAAVGGAPLNVAIGLSRLLDHVAMITRVGNDPIGLEIIKTLRA